MQRPAKPLSERQVEILRLVSQGLTNAKIATTLFLSEHTVHRHLANIYALLDARTRNDAVRVAVEQGLL